MALSAEEINTPENDAEKHVDQSSAFDETQYYMSGSKLGILIGSLCLALFLLGLDTAIISTVGRL